MAYGIDAAAHRGALAAEGYTAAILANGADIPYPSGLAGLTDSLLTGGVTLLSVYPPGTRPARKTFLERASFLASLARAVVVVEAGLASGALRIAHAAAEAGIPVFAVPGPVTSAVSAGANQLLIDGVARPAADSHDVLTRL
jgi:DNA processing protein